MLRKTSMVFFLTISFLFLELLLSVSILRTLWPLSSIRLVLFTLSYALGMVFILAFFRQKGSRILLLVFLIAFTTLFLSLDLYYRVMGDFFSLVLSGDAWRGVTFIYRIRLHLRWHHLLYFTPLTVWLLFRQYLYIKPYQHRLAPLLMLVLTLVSFVGALSFINQTPPIESDSPFNFSELDIYEKLPSAYQFIHHYGVLTYVRRDLQSLWSNRQVDALETMDEIEAFLSSQTHERHTYSRIFRNMNLVFIVAESLDYYAIDEDLMPNLHRLYTQGWQMNNFHAPHYYRNTADTEFMVHTGFYPDRQVQLSMQAYVDNAFPMTLPRLFEARGYDTFAFHNYVDYFYPRREFLTQTVGFSSYKDAIDMGLMNEEDAQAGSHPWPSDFDMMQETLPDWIESDRFYAYYLTVSGHMPYHAQHPQVEKNLETIEALLEAHDREIENPNILGYLAANLELERMLEYLLEELDAHGRRHDTVIVLMSDHYPYGLDLDELIEMHPEKTIEDSRLDLHRVPFIVYHPWFFPRSFHQVFSSVDVTPTLANLFDLNFQPGFTVGRDGLSSFANTVRFQNGSIRNRYYQLDITQQYQITHFTEAFTDDEVMLFFNEMIYLQTLNQRILQSNYFGPDEDEVSPE